MEGGEATFLSDLNFSIVEKTKLYVIVFVCLKANKTTSASFCAELLDGLLFLEI